MLGLTDNQLHAQHEYHESGKSGDCPGYLIGYSQTNEREIKFFLFTLLGLSFFEIYVKKTPMIQVGNYVGFRLLT